MRLPTNKSQDTRHRPLRLLPAVKHGSEVVTWHHVAKYQAAAHLQRAQNRTLQHVLPPSRAPTSRLSPNMDTSRMNPPPSPSPTPKSNPARISQTAILGFYQSLRAYQIPTGSTAAQTGEALSARRFGTWTFLSGIVRLYAVYDMDNSGLYILAFWTYVIACTHFAAERMVSGARINLGAVGVSLVSIGLMVAHWSSYV